MFTPSNSQRHDFNMSEAQANIIHGLLRSEIAAHKNWIATQVEAGNLEQAQKLVKDMRGLENIAKSFNMEAKYTIAEMSDKPLQTQHKVEL